MKGSPLLGAQYLKRGFATMRLAELRWFVLLPLLLNIVLMGGVSWWGIGQISTGVDIVVNWLPEWLSWLSWILLPIAILTLVVVVMYFFSTFLNLISSPFNGLLSEAVENKVAGTILPEESLTQTVVRTLKREVRKILYFLPRYALLLIISFIPVINMASPVLWFMFGAWVLTLQYLDYALDNNGHDFADLHKALRLQPLTVLGFGAVVALGLIIPLLNLLVMPAAVCGVTLYWIEQVKPQFQQENKTSSSRQPTSLSMLNR